MSCSEVTYRIPFSLKLNLIPGVGFNLLFAVRRLKLQEVLADFSPVKKMMDVW